MRIWTEWWSWVQPLRAACSRSRSFLWLLAALASGRLSLAGLVTHRIAPAELGTAYDGLMKQKDEYLGVVVLWK